VQAPALEITGTTYYVSPSGSDSNSGTSPSSPWRTVKRVNAADLQPGDGVLFQGGATFDDDTLMPAGSGAAGSPIVFGSYGTGDAVLPLGVWFREESHFGFEHLAIGPEADLQGTGNDVTVEWCSFEDPTGLGINAMGSDWTIDDNTVNDTGNSGMLLEGENYVISGNTISNTGLDSAIAYGKHGIYLKVGNATVSENTITNFSADGISARHHDSTIVGNYISGGPIGIAWFQMDTVAGTSHWVDNTITDTSEAGIYVSAPTSESEHTLESFVVEHNQIQPSAGVFMNLKQTLGTYTVQANALL
jgi:Right handed beta helix region